MTHNNNKAAAGAGTLVSVSCQQTALTGRIHRSSVQKEWSTICTAFPFITKLTPESLAAVSLQVVVRVEIVRM